MATQIHVLIVDDSALVRKSLAQILGEDPDICVMGTASDPFFAAQKMKTRVPDVITLDVEMPRMDGLTFLQKIMTQHPLPVVICSSLTGNGSETAMKALEFGAVEVIQKPALGTRQFIHESRIRIIDAVKAAAQTRIRKTETVHREIAPKLTADVMLKRYSASGPVGKTRDKIITVGASTGGTEALRIFCQALPPDAPGTVVVQHMPEHFTRTFARRLDQLSRVRVREARNHDAVLPGQVLIAPGDQHMLLKRGKTGYYVEVRTGPLVSRHRPSVDVLFRSAARYAGPNCIGVIMTGMGDDGARGMVELKEAGALTIAQDQATSVVFGMPKEAIRRKAVDMVLPLQDIAEEILRHCPVGLEHKRKQNHTDNQQVKRKLDL